MKLNFISVITKNIHQDETIHTIESTSCRLTQKHFDQADAIWVDADSDQGFFGEESVILRFANEALVDFLAIERHSDFWSRPVFGNDLQAVPNFTQMLLIHTPKDTYQCYLPVCDDTFKTVLRGTKDGLEAVVYSNFDGLKKCEHQLALVIGEGNDPHALVHDCTSLAAQLLGNGLLMREERKMPEMLEYLGWCSWDALQYRISHEGLLEKAKEFSEKNVPIHFAILDDMWADIPDFALIPEPHTFRELVNVMHQSRIKTFDGDSKRFPKGMRAAIDDLKQAGIPTVGLWYPTTGYWKGFYEDSDLVEQYPECFMHANPGRWHKEGEKIVLVKPETDSANRFFDVLAEQAKSWGIDFVKIDNQGYHKHYKNLYPIGKSARNIQRAIDAATEKHFDGAMINCMGMPPECLFNRPKTVISRCSDDFMPESKEWFAKNILQCSYNGLLQGQYYVNDWDMFWTDDEQAVKNSVCRAISGGPIYVSDMIGRTRPEILKPLALSDGRILRPDNSAMPTKDCVTVNPTKSGKAFKIFNRVGDCGLIAAFHVDVNQASVKGSISASDARLLDRDYLYYEYFTKTCGILKAGESFSFDLENRDTFRLYTLIPYNQNAVTFLGRCDKMIGIKAIESIDGNIVTLKEGGMVGFYSTKPVRVFAGERELPVKHENGYSYVVSQENECVLRFQPIN